MSTSKTGKHGHAKVNLTAIDIFTGKKYEDIVPSTHNVECPHVNKNDYTLVDINDGFLSMMTDTGEMKEDLKLPEGELGDQIQSAFDDGKELLVSVTSALGKEQALAFKEVVQK